MFLHHKNIRFNDFSIKSYAEHRLKGLINLQGIESPGLTSSMAIGKHIKNILMV